MSIKFKAVPKPNPTKPTEPNKYYPRAISSGRVELKDLASRISSKSTTVSDIDTQAVLMALTKELKVAIDNGETVHLGDLGYFHITLKGTGEATEKAVSGANIESAKLRFVAGREIEDSLKTARFEKVSG